MSTSISVAVNLDLIQSIRLVQALTESAYDVYIPETEVWRFSELRRCFSVPLVSSPQQISVPIETGIDHSEPLTSLGTLSRPLIFPREILGWCKDQWKEQARDIDTSFCGLVTKDRKTVLQDWLNRQSGSSTNRVELSKTLLNRIKSKLFGARPIKTERLYKFNSGHLFVWSSTRGRVFPLKAWDEEYFRILLRSKFVLCPVGDYIWSYRFFEAIMCGAIPIVQDSCPAYAGFKFYGMKDAVGLWSEEMAEHNYRLCMERLTIPEADLNAEIARLSRASGAPSQ